MITKTMAQDITVDLTSYGGTTLARRQKHCREVLLTICKCCRSLCVDLFVFRTRNLKTLSSAGEFFAALSYSAFLIFPSALRQITLLSQNGSLGAIGYPFHQTLTFTPGYIQTFSRMLRLTMVKLNMSASKSPAFPRSFKVGNELPTRCAREILLHCIWGTTYQRLVQTKGTTLKAQDLKDCLSTLLRMH